VVDITHVEEIWLTKDLAAPLRIKYRPVKQLVEALNHTSYSLQYTHSMFEATVKTDTHNSQFAIEGKIGYMCG
jgi:tRNA G26 N,N-dimethylase Trm1